MMKFRTNHKCEEKMILGTAFLVEQYENKNDPDSPSW